MHVYLHDLKYYLYTFKIVKFIMKMDLMTIYKEEEEKI